MRQIALGIVVTGLIATSAWAEEPASRRLVTSGALAGVSFSTPVPQAAPEPEEKPYTVSVGLDVPTDYVWRGVLQENEGFIAQPFVDLGIALSDKVSFNAGVWTSLHSGEATKTFYEADYYAGIGFSAGKWSPSVTYTAYASPNDTFTTAHELAVSVGYDDSESSLPLSPSATLAFFNLSDEVQTYLELGVEPAVPTEGALSLSFPVAIGLSLKDFYADSFGFFKVGVAAGTDLGSGWEAHAGFDLLFLSDYLQWDDNSVKPVFSVGFSYTY